MTTFRFSRRLAAGLALAGAALGLSGCVGAPAAAPAEPVEITSAEAYEHLIGTSHPVRTPDPVDFPTQVSVETVVGVDGTVLSARLVDGPAALAARAEAAALQDRYSPFLVDGVPVPVRFIDKNSVFQEILPTTHRPFPEIGPETDVTVSMDVGPCFGPCPVYAVAIDRDGTERFRGGRYVAAMGTYTYRIDPATVAALLDAFRKADFFSLSDEYIGNLTDTSRSRIAITIDGHTKTVVEEAGYLAGMPTAVRELEAAIDHVAETADMIEGTPATVAMMKAQDFDFASREGADLLVNAIECCSTAYIMALLDAGVALSGRDHRGMPAGRLARYSHEDDVADAILAAAIARGTAEERSLALFDALLFDPDAVRRLVKLENDPADIDKAIGENGFPLLLDTACYGTTSSFDLLMELGADPNVTNPDGETALYLPCTAPYWPRLIAAGANIEARNRYDQTPLIEWADEEAALALTLLRAGADATARDDNGQTALFSVVDAALARALLAAGADPRAVDRQGQTALHYVGNAGVVPILVAAGADPNARTDRGRTPLMVAQRRDVALALIAAGADMALRDDRGAKALDVARSLNRQEVVDTLVAAGAR